MPRATGVHLLVVDGCASEAAPKSSRLLCKYVPNSDGDCAVQTTRLMLSDDLDVKSAHNFEFDGGLTSSAACYCSLSICTRAKACITANN